MVNVDKLRGKIVEQRVSMRELAHELRLDRSTLYRRFSENGCTFTIAEADIIARKLNLSAQEASAIFFCSICRIKCDTIFRRKSYE